MHKNNNYILVFNSGSSSLKFQLVAGLDASQCLLRGILRDFGEQASCEWIYRGSSERLSVAAEDHAAAAGLVFELLEQITDAGQSLLKGISAIGHRIVHGGEMFFEPTLLSNETLTTLEALSPLAPLHNPPALAVISACRERLPGIPQVAVFDTAFFHGLPEFACRYALPAEWSEGQGIRRYGFHGLAHRYMAECFAELCDRDVAKSRLITLQLGHGCSVAAIRDGKPLETSMGFTPLEGLIMATRPGDLDAGIVLHLLERDQVSPGQLNDGLNRRAGLLGLSGVSADMRELLALEAEGHSGAQLAISAFCHRARKYIGAYLAVLGGADAIIFGGGIGEHAADIRARICAGMEWCGLVLDEQANRSAVGTQACISTRNSHPAVYVIPVDEELLVARDTLNLNREVQN